MADIAAPRYGAEGGKLQAIESEEEHINHLRSAEVALHVRPKKLHRYWRLRPINPEKPIDLERTEQPMNLERTMCKETVFIAFDLEGKDHITQVGFSVLHLSNIKGKKPGRYGHCWFKKTETEQIWKTWHLRVEQYRCYGDQALAESFPGSKFVPLAQLRSTIESFIHWQTDQGKRDLVLVGHDVRHDIQLLKDVLQFDIEIMPGFKLTLDTQRLFSAFLLERRHTNGFGSADTLRSRSLEKVAGFFGCPTDNWHNAAWDAEYTLKAMVAIVVETASARTFGSTDKRDMQEYFERLAQGSSQATIHITGYDTPRCSDPLWLREMILTTFDRNKNLLIVERSPKIVAKLSAKLFSYGISHGYTYGHGYRYEPMDSGLQAAYESNFNSGINRIMIVDTERLQHITAAVSQIVVLDFMGIGAYRPQSPGGYIQALIDQIKRPGYHTTSTFPSGQVVMNGVIM